MGSAWLSGFNLYATVLTLGMLQRFHLVQLPGGLEALSRWWVIGLTALLYLIEFVADKIPFVDSVWDAVHTFIRVPAGAVLAASAFANFDPAVRIVALLAGGTLALGSHSAKAGIRLTANASPEPFSNFVLSTLEDLLTIALTTLAAFHPLAILVMIFVFILLMIWLGPKAVGAIRALFVQLAAFRNRPA